MGEIKIFENAQFGQVRTTISASNEPNSSIHGGNCCQSMKTVVIKDLGEVKILEDDIEIHIYGSKRVYNSCEYVELISTYGESLEKAKEAFRLLDLGPLHNPIYRARYFMLGFQMCAYFEKKDGNKGGNKDSKTYLMHDSNTGYTKIGRSVNPRMRERTLQSEKPSIALFAICDELVEKELHQQYKDKRVRGEWFDLSKDEINDIIADYDFAKIL